MTIEIDNIDNSACWDNANSSDIFEDIKNFFVLANSTYRPDEVVFVPRWLADLFLERCPHQTEWFNRTFVVSDHIPSDVIITFDNEIFRGWNDEAVFPSLSGNWWGTNACWKKLGQSGSSKNEA